MRKDTTQRRSTRADKQNTHAHTWNDFSVSCVLISWSHQQTQTRGNRETRQEKTLLGTTSSKNDCNSAVSVMKSATMIPPLPLPPISRHTKDKGLRNQFFRWTSATLSPSLLHHIDAKAWIHDAVSQYTHQCVTQLARTHESRFHLTIRWSSAYAAQEPKLIECCRK